MRILVDGGVIEARNVSVHSAVSLDVSFVAEFSGGILPDAPIGSVAEVDSGWGVTRVSAFPANGGGIIWLADAVAPFLGGIGEGVQPLGTLGAVPLVPAKPSSPYIVYAEGSFSFGALSVLHIWIVFDVTSGVLSILDQGVTEVYAQTPNEFTMAAVADSPGFILNVERLSGSDYVEVSGFLTFV